MEDPREILVACAHGSYDDGEDSSDCSSVSSSSSLPLPSTGNTVTARESVQNRSSRARNYPKSIKDIP